MKSWRPVELSNEWRVLWNQKRLTRPTCLTRFVTWPEEDGKIRKQQTKKTDETHLRSFRFFEAARCVETPSPSKSLKSRQVQLGVEMSISYNVNIIHLIVTQDSSKKTKKTHLSEQHPPHIGADFGLLSRSFKIFRGLRMLRKISNVSNVAGKRILLVLLQSPWPRRTRWTPTETKRKRALIPNPKALRQLLRQLFSCQESIGKCQTAGPKGNWVLKSSEGSPSTFSVRRDACVVVVVHFV